MVANPPGNVPYRQNPFFTGREDILRAIRQGLQMESTVALCHPLGITGLGGIGKTQTALEYIYCYHENYTSVFWIRADSTASLIASFLEVAKQLGLPERNKKEQHIIVEAVLCWLRLHEGWLLVFDSMDDLRIVEPFLPTAGQGHLLFTTRVHAIGSIAHRLELQTMEPEIGALLLLRKASLLPLGTSLEAASADKKKTACTISQELGGLPLALDQAGAYIKEIPCTLEDYLARYQERHQDLLRARGSFDPHYPASVATTWSLSFEKISQSNPAAAELLNFCAFLAPDAIPERIITEGAIQLGHVLQSLAADPIQLDLACREILRFSLFYRSADEQTFTIHRLVQAVLKDRMDEESQRRWAERAIRAVNATLPPVEHETWSRWEEILAHTLVCSKLIEQDHLLFAEGARLLQQTGWYLTERVRYEEAELLLKRAISIDGRMQGLEHLDTARDVSTLAYLYQTQGRYVEAEPLYEQALAIREHQLGATHPSTATTLNNLAALYYGQGKYGEAELLYEQALMIREQQLGAIHPLTAISLNNLAALYKDWGKYAQAEPLYERALAICEQQLGAIHPDTAMSLKNLATLYLDQGKYAEAEPLYRRALATCEQVLGVMHPDTASSLNSLAALYYEQGKYTEAEPLDERALMIREQTLGAMHPFTATSLNNLADLYCQQGKYEQAEPLYERALVVKEQVLGAMHPNTATGLNNLAALYYRQRKYAEAEKLYQRALVIREQQLGAMHPDTASSLNNLAALYKSQGKYEQAEPLYGRALSICEHHLGHEHPTTRIIRGNYAALLQELGRIDG